MCELSNMLCALDKKHIITKCRRPVYVSAKMKMLNCWSGLPIWLLWSQNSKFWLLLNTFGFFCKSKTQTKFRFYWLFFSWKGLAPSKHCLSCIFINRSLLTRVYDCAGYKEYCKDFTVALKMVDVIYKKQM